MTGWLRPAFPAFSSPGWMRRLMAKLLPRASANRSRSKHCGSMHLPSPSVSRPNGSIFSRRRFWLSKSDFGTKQSINYLMSLTLTINPASSIRSLDPTRFLRLGDYHFPYYRILMRDSWLIASRRNFGHRRASVLWGHPNRGLLRATAEPFLPATLPIIRVQF